VEFLNIISSEYELSGEVMGLLDRRNREFRKAAVKALVSKSKSKSKSTNSVEGDDMEDGRTQTQEQEQVQVRVMDSQRAVSFNASLALLEDADDRDAALARYVKVYNLYNL